MNTSELFALSINLLVGGSETTMNLVASALYSLLRFPSQLELLRRDPSRMRNAVEEFLRFESPAQFQSRTSTQPIEVRGVTIPPGQTIYLCLGSANHDERRIPDAERFDVLRDPNPHLAFGFGAHFCLGANLARLEARVAFEELLARLPDYRTTGSRVERICSGPVRGALSLPVSVA